MSQAAAAHVLEVVENKPDALLCLPTGASPLGMYSSLSGNPAILRSRIRAMALDEWHGLGRRHPSTCLHYLETHVFPSWGIEPSHCFHFDSEALDPESECGRMDGLLKLHGPFDLCILGLGRNGHLGLNEPGEFLLPHAHVAQLDPTSQTHGMLRSQGACVTAGMTFGMADILESKEILMLLAGEDKEGVAHAFLEGRIRTNLPASFLHLHHKVKVLVDATMFQ
jgi:galactosamine-6-phosphate isomerase